jgi:hypothetical protein
MSEWQPIETAPKDGTKVILNGIGESGWNNDNIKEFEIVATGYFKFKLWQTGSIWRWKTPTHWMPLPEPPA